ncbi:exodeoxyribonuclease V subunit beta, partial [Pseudomonas syringae pv. actinidiae ICMP 18807]
PRVRGLFGRDRSTNTQAPAELIEASLLERRAALAALKAPWAAWADELYTLCQDAVARKLVDGRKMQERFF